MQHATTIWAEKLQARLKNLRASAPASASNVSSEHVVVGDLSRPVTSQERVRPEIEEARKAVTRMAELIDVAEQRAARAEEELQTITRFVRAQLDDCRAQTKASDKALALMESAAESDAQLAAEQLRGVESRAAAAQERVEELERQTAAASDALSRTEEVILDANRRVLAAEASASEATAEIKYLELFIRDRFDGLGGNSGFRNAAAA